MGTLARRHAEAVVSTDSTPTDPSSGQTSDPVAGGPDEPKGPPNRWKVLAVIAATLQLVVIDMTVLHVAAPSISADLRPSAVELLWIIDVYSLVVAPLLVLAATMGDRFGRKRTLIWGLTFFTAASVLAAAAWSPTALIFARALQGVGGAILLPSTMAIIRDVFPDRDERVRAIGIWSASMAAGAAAGPIIGGLMIEAFSWQAVFLLNVPVFFVVLPFALKMIPESRSSNPPEWDPFSVALVAAGVLLFAYGLKDAARHGLEPAPIGCLLLSFALLTVFARRQLRLDNPTLELRLFKTTAFRVAVAAVVLTMFAMVGLELFFAQYFQLVLGLGPAASSIRLVPFLLATLAGGLTAGWFLTRFGTRTVMAVGLGAAGLSVLPILAVGLTDQYWLFLPGFVAVGLGLEVALVAGNDVILSSATGDQAGQASAIEETAYELGGGLGVAVLGSILAAVYTGSVVLPEGAPASARESISEAALVAETLPQAVGDALLLSSRQAFVEGLHTVIIVSAVVTVAAALIAWIRLSPGRSGGRADDEPLGPDAPRLTVVGDDAKSPRV
ncbi:MAG: MFS transporter [Solirubrobacteraceae bacterium]|nr:MFS transporter [Solirubrobacteraceae bacterium]